jgi:hypothetical protein
MQFRDNWGFEFDYSLGKSKDSDIKYGSYELDFSSWYNISPKWNANLNGGFARTYNFSRDYLAFYTWWNVYLDWKATDVVDLGTSYNMWVEGDPQGNIADITYDARPYISVTPINDLNFRIYVDNLFVKSSDRLEHILGGLLFSYNFSPKSWIYFAYNELRDRSDQYDPAGNLLPNKMHVAARAGVLKVKYLYYF